MHFSTLPPAYAPIGQPLICTLTEISSPSVDVRILLSSGRLLGTKRFVKTGSASFDLAPYLRGQLRVTPSAEGATGVVAATDRQLMIYLEAESDEELITSAPFILRPALQSETPTALLTTLPTERLLAPDESDELLFLSRTPQPLHVVVTGRDGSVTADTHIVPGSGLFRFTLRGADFATADHILIDGTPTGTIRYTMLPAPEGACRLAWLSERGSLEQYTFPLVERVACRVTKNRSYGAEGYTVQRAESEEQIQLRSALEGDEMLSALRGLLTAEQVWMRTAEGFVPIDVLSEEADIHRHGILSSLALTIRPTLKNTTLWSC